MQIIIILLLIIIFILAPWTILVAIGAAAVYGTYLVIGGVLLALGIACYLAKDKISALRSRHRMNAMIEESNRIARQREIEEKHKAPPARRSTVETEEVPNEAPRRICRSCQVELAPGELRCSSCKTTIQ